MTSFLPPVNDFEREGIEKIRELFRDELPSDLDTDFNLRRWVAGWKGDMKEIEPRLRTYIDNRKALNLDAADLLEKPPPTVVVKAMKHLSVSVRLPPPVNPIDNTIVFVYRLENMDFRGLTKLLTPSDYLYVTFASTEIMLRYILRQEAVSGKPSAVSFIYDMHGMHLTDFMNPAAPHMKLSSLAMALQQDYYCNLMHQIVCIRIPAFMNVVWGITKRLMNESTLKKFFMYTEGNYPEHILEHLHPSVVPEFYGGQWREEEIVHSHFQVKVDGATCATIPQPVAEDEYATPTWTPEKWSVEYIRPKQTWTVVKSVTANEFLSTMIKWQFETNGNVEFAVYLKDAGGSRKLVQPKLVLCTPYFPEEKQLLCSDYGYGDYVFQFTNVSTTWFSLKLSYCIVLSNE